MFYLFIFFVLLLFACCDVDKKLDAKSRRFAYSFVFLIFWLVAGLRYEIGVDWFNYTEYFDRMDSIAVVVSGASDVFKNSEFEVGYAVLNSVVKAFTDNAQWLFLLIAFATSLVLFTSLQKYSNHIFVSLLIYFCTMYFVMNMDGIRQCISLNIFFMSLQYVVKRNPIKYLVAICIASLFHQTAIFLLPLYFVLNREFRGLTLLIVVGCGMLIAFAQVMWLKLLVRQMMDLDYSGYIMGKLYRYSTGNTERQYGLGFILNLLILIFSLAKRRELKAMGMYNIFVNMYVLSLACYYFIWETGILSSRFRLYFSVGNIVLLTYFIDAYKNRTKKWMVFCFIVCIAFIYGRTQFLEMPEAIPFNPYQNYIVSKALDIPSTGLERLQSYEELTGE